MKHENTADTHINLWSRRMYAPLLSRPIKFPRARLKFALWTLILFTTVFAGSNVFAQTTLNDVDVAALSDDRVQVKFRFNGTPPEPLAFTIDNPARIALDFASTSLGLEKRFQSVNIGKTKSINTAQAKDRTRVVIELSSLQEYQTSIDGNVLTLTIGDNIGSQVAAAPVSQTSANIKQTSIGRNNQVNKIDFRRGEGGAGRLLIGLSDPSIPVDIQEQGGRITISFGDAQLQENIQKRFDVTDFATPIQSVEAFNRGSDSRIIVTPDPSVEYEHLAYQSDNLYVLEVREIPREVVETRRRETYEGERLSLNFQDIEVRSVLQLIADFTGLNLVVSDSVSGSLTLRLKNVPWDQALDIILKTKGLDMRENGNVLYVAPSEEIAAREKLELESQQQVEELAPLYSEFIAVNYASASDLAALMKDADNTLLSERGQVSVDERTNTVLIQDTAQKLNEIRRLVERLDVPVKQVLIESRIVIANDDFSKEIGVRFGANNIDSNDIGAGRAADIATGSLDVLEPLTNGDDIPIEDTLNVDLPVANPAGQIALAVAKLPFGFLVELELSAAQTESRAEIISNPRVITSNQATARIEQGTEIPYQEASSSGATSVSFKKAVLALEVTPQITPDERVSMELNVTNDSVGLLFAGIPSIDTRQVTTNVLVDNGQTIVLGGVYQEESTIAATRVPFFSDIPLLGRAFRRDSNVNNKSELLIFITPKIISEELAVVR